MYTVIHIAIFQCCVAKELMANVSTGFLALVLHSCGQFKWIIGLYQV